MPSDPSNSPPGATPVLPTPRGDAANRAADLFRKVLARQQGEQQSSPAAPSASPPTAPACSPRSYQLALAAVSRATGVPSQASQADAPADSHASEPPDEVPNVDRPPPGAPTVRPSPSVAGPAAEQSTDEIIAKSADTAWLHGDRHAATFEVTFRDDLFVDLRCRIEIKEGRVSATFLVADNDTRRLLEAEAGRLRAQLEQRGLRVDAVNVEMV